MNAFGRPEMVAPLTSVVWFHCFSPSHIKMSVHCAALTPQRVCWFQGRPTCAECFPILFISMGMGHTGGFRS